jgi:hypothetical protein
MPDIRHSISIDASPERIHPLTASGAGFSKWWAADTTENPSTGVVDLGFFTRATLYRVQPVRIAAPLEAEWLCQTGKEWAGTKLSFKLIQKDGPTLLQFAHAGWQSDTDYFVACNTNWGELMFRLKAAAEGKNPGPLFSGAGMAY